MKYIYYILSLIFFWVQFSCSTDTHQDDDPGEEEEKELDISVNVRGDDNYYDDKVITLRIMAFERTDLNTPISEMKCVRNNYYVSSDTVFRLHIKEGLYDLVIVANEISDSNTSDELYLFNSPGFNGGNYDNTLKYLYDNITFDESAFATNKYIPMSALIRNIEVLGDTLYKFKEPTDTPTHHGRIPVQLVRLGVKLDLKLTTEIEKKKNSLDKLIISQLPKKVPVFPTQYNTDIPIDHAIHGYTNRTILVNQGDKNDQNEVWTKNGSTYTWEKKRIIIPSSVFANPETNNKKGIGLDVHYNTTEYSRERAWLGFKTRYTLPLPSNPPYNYTLPRNTYLDFTGKMVEHNIEFEYIKIEGWGNKEDIPIEN